jgi:hypothetical protein
MNVLANPKESAGRWNLNFWRFEQFYTNCNKVETPIHDSTRELVTWKWKEIMEWNHECVCKSERRCWALESEFLEAWAILHKFLKQRCCRHLFQAVNLSKTNKGAHVKQQKWWWEKVHVCIKNWEFHLVTPPRCQKLPSSITKTTHVKFWATSGSLPTTLWWYYRRQN